MNKASILNRWLAIFIENIILGFALMIPNFMISMAGSMESVALLIVGCLLYLVILIGFLVVQIKFWKQSTSIGKKLLKLKVVKFDTYEPLSLGDMFLRETIGKWISSIFMIGYIMALIDPDNRALHDRIVSSIVVVDDLNAGPNQGFGNQANY